MAMGVDFLLDALIREGVEHLFMVPGGLVDPFLAALSRHPNITPIVAAHEGGAAYMADGYARAGGRFGAALGIGGPGLCNMGTAIAAAKTDSSPILVMSGEIATDMEGLGQFQDASQATLDDASLMRPVTRLSASVASTRSLGHWLRHGLTSMLERPSGPVHLSLAHDALVTEFDGVHTPVRPFFDSVAPLSVPAAQKAIDRLAESQRLAILAGAGIEHDSAFAQLKATAERWSIPVATTLRAKGAFPEDHELSLGVFGYAGSRHATLGLFANDLDVLLVLGSGLNERDTMHWTLRQNCRADMILVNTDMQEITSNGQANRIVPGSCRAFLDFWSGDGNARSAALAKSAPARQEWLARVKAEERLYDADNCRRTSRPIHPAAAVAAMRDAFPRDGIALVDSGAHRAFAGHYWSAYEPRTYLSATNLGPMGWAIPAAVGAQCARPDRRVAVITGDGCMQMHGMEVQTAARYRLPIAFMVLNNAALGNVWLRAHTLGPLPAELTTTRDHDWAGFARSLGAEGMTVEDPAALRQTFERAVSANATVVVDVKTDKNCATPVYDFAAGKRAWSYNE
jgi:acetolactate synthase I/II/III large subunit